MSQHEVDESLGSVPRSLSVQKALDKLKNGKAAGSSGILPEMLKVGRKHSEFVDMLTELVSEVWSEQRVPQEWVDAILVPISKKGNLYTFVTIGGGLHCWMW